MLVVQLLSSAICIYSQDNNIVIVHMINRKNVGATNFINRTFHSDYIDGILVSTDVSGDREEIFRNLLLPSEL